MIPLVVEVNNLTFSVFLLTALRAEVASLAKLAPLIAEMTSLVAHVTTLVA